MQSIVDLTDRKRDTGYPKRVFVAGCLAQRYADDLLQELPGIDGLVGVGQWQQLTELILEGHDADALRNRVRALPTVDVEQFMRRKRIDNSPFSFLKISDGCNHGCTFCSIPSMKGRHKSVAPEILLAEAKNLIDQGVKEIILVAQDLSDYGKDMKDGGYRLPRLLRELCALEGDFWVRCMYVYPAGVTDEFLDVMANEPKLAKYIDVPLQHLDPETMKRMNRPSKDANTSLLVQRLRDAIPDIAIRTTMIVGFPGETRMAHLNMVAQMKALRFNWLGAFRYSTEENTPAGTMAGQLSKTTKERRWRAVMETQVEITAEINKARIGKMARVLVEGFDSARNQWYGRSQHESPEIDGCVYIESDEMLKTGSFVDTEIIASDVYDVTARVCKVAAAIS